jgi:hypothetical protein
MSTVSRSRPPWSAVHSFDGIQDAHEQLQCLFGVSPERRAMSWNERQERVGAPEDASGSTSCRYTSIPRHGRLTS